MNTNTNTSVPELEELPIGEVKDSARDIDHHDMKTEERVDNTTDEEGTETREKVRQGTPGYITSEFRWVFNSEVVSTPDSRMLDKHWQLRPLPTTIDKVVADAPRILEARQNEILGDTDARDMQESLYNDTLEQFRTLLVMNNWLLYGVSLALLSQGAKEVASAVRFALRAREWQLRDGEAEGPRNMMESALGQSLRGAILINVVLRAYNEVSGDGATPLKLDERTFRTAAYTALGIEANKLKKQYDHPGKAAQRADANDQASTADYDAFSGKPISK
jgi:hypothetical protein